MILNPTQRGKPSRAKEEPLPKAAWWSSKSKPKNLTGFMVSFKKYT